MVPIFPMILGEFVSILSGSLVIEKIFGVPGVGQLYINSINGLDYNFFMLLSKKIMPAATIEPLFLQKRSIASLKYPTGFVSNFLSWIDASCWQSPKY